MMTRIDNWTKIRTHLRNTTEIVCFTQKNYEPKKFDMIGATISGFVKWA